MSDVSGRMSTLAADHPPSPPAVEGFVLHEFIGRGGSGMVWRATQEGTMREVALKVLAPWRAHVWAPLRFEREAEIAASLEHEAIARVFGAGDCPTGPWIAMELVLGPPADDWVRETHPSLCERVVFFSRVCAGMSHAHQRGVIHRDLKPGNVLVSQDGTPKIVDFGLARRDADDSLEVDFTREGDFLGTLAWMPPEQARGDWTEVDALSDVYALGAILFGLVAGTAPLDSKLPPAAQLAAAQSGERRRLREVMAKAPRDLEAVVARCLHARKLDRYQSVAELSADLDRWLIGEPVRAPVGAPFYWVRKKLRRHWKATALSSAGALSAVGLAGGYLQGKARVEAERTAALEREAEQRKRTLHEAQELVTQLLVEMRPYFDQAGHPEWIEEAERRLLAFPWDETLRGPYDARRFRSRTALVQGDTLAAKGQWANALEAYHNAIDHLKTLVPENPDVALFREELVRARLGETKALVRLGFHKEAYRAARHVLDLTDPRSGRPISNTLTTAMVEGVEQLGAACLPMPGRASDALDVARRAHEQLAALTPTPTKSPESAEWQARLSLWIARLSVHVEEASQVKSDTSHAEAAARHFASLTAQGERSGRLLASALVVAGDLALRENDTTRARQAIEEATQRVGDCKLPGGLSGSVHVEVAGAWERLAGAAGLEDISAAMEANDRAIGIWSDLVRHASPTERMVALSRLCLSSTRLAQRANDRDALAKYGLLTVRKFELGLRKDAVRPVMALDSVEAAILLIDAGIPPRTSGSSWLESTAAAWQWLEKNRQRIHPESQVRMAELRPRVAALLGL